MKQYFPLEPIMGKPWGENVYYECTKCGKVFHANFKENVRCDCKNILIDGDYGKLNILDYAFAKGFREFPDQSVTF